MSRHNCRMLSTWGSSRNMMVRYCLVVDIRRNRPIKRMNETYKPIILKKKKLKLFQWYGNNCMHQKKWRLLHKIHHLLSNQQDTIKEKKTLLLYLTMTLPPNSRNYFQKSYIKKSLDIKRCICPYNKLSCSQLLHLLGALSWAHLHYWLCKTIFETLSLSLPHLVPLKSSSSAEKGENNPCTWYFLPMGTSQATVHYTEVHESIRIRLKENLKLNQWCKEV